MWPCTYATKVSQVPKLGAQTQVTAIIKELMDCGAVRKAVMIIKHFGWEEVRTDDRCKEIPCGRTMQSQIKSSKV